MATFKLKNNATDSGFIPGVGNFVDGVLKGAPETFENPNFELVKSTADELAESEAAGKAKEQTAASAPAPAAPTAPAAPAASPAPTVPQIDAEMQGLEEERNKIEKTEGAK